MTLPLIDIDTETGRLEYTEKIFDNNEYGLIVEDTVTNKRATYLPKVFEKSVWNAISTSLIEKASIQTNADLIKFYAYQGVLIEKTIYDHLAKPFIKFMEKYISSSNGIPYTYTNREVKYDADEYVRNMATIRDLLILQNDGFVLSDRLIENIRSNIEKHVAVFEKNKKQTRQSLPFIMIAIVIIIENERKYDVLNSMEMYLLDQLNDIKKHSREFEYGEVLMGLSYLAIKMDKKKYSRPNIRRTK